MGSGFVLEDDIVDRKKERMWIKKNIAVDIGNEAFDWEESNYG